MARSLLPERDQSSSSFVPVTPKEGCRVEAQAFPVPLEGGEAKLAADAPFPVMAVPQHHSNRIGAMVLEQGMTPCIPSRRNRTKRLPHSKRLHRKHHQVENLLARLKNWQPIATRYDRCAHIFLSAVFLAAIVIFW